MTHAKERLAAALILLLASCGAPGPVAVVGPPPGKAVVVFLRPALLDDAAPSPVIDITSEPPVLVGVVPAGRKVTYVSDPGDRRLMVAGDDPDFMDAELVAGRIYYVRIALHLGASKRLFSLRPVAAGDPALASELADCSWMSDTEVPSQWAQDNMASVQKKKAAYLPAWLARPDRSTLKARDAR
jgi:hypothetical protein